MIYIVEDDTEIREMMLYTLKSTGFSAEGFPDASAFWTALEKETPSLVMLDIMLPGEDGIEILKKLRARAATAELPVIMTTAKGAEYDKIMGLDLGADDYLVKPFGMMEMVSRAKAVLRRTNKAVNKDKLQIGKLSLEDEKHLVFVGESSVALTLKEYELLRLFMESPGRVFTRDNLLESIWGMDYDGETRTVDVHIRTLRAKLCECGEYISTVRGVGYRMEETK
ncbi:MAG: response regulator transcription factor [Ruminococcaceae bacterium]|nr:response regulator transcription factor [Oscillospiraceae bacterium]